MSRRFTMEVVTQSGRAAMVAFVVHPDTVEVWHHNRCSGVIDRVRLRTWLAAPGRPIVVDEAAFSLDRMVDSDGRVALSLPDVLVWTLAPMVLQELQRVL